MLTSGVNLRITGILLLILTTAGRGYSQEAEMKTFRLMFYNTENLFDIFNDSLKDDDAFLPDGLMRWNQARYNKKINSLYKTITAAGEWNAPAVVALSEVENRNVLEDLLLDTYLSKINYGIIHQESPDLRGIDVCMIYRKDCVHVIDYKYWIPETAERFRSRSVLYTSLFIGKDTIHVIVNHWPSRRGGVLSGEDLRMKIAGMVRKKTDSIMEFSHSRAKIIIAGDFNCTPDDQVIKSIVSSAGKEKYLINLSEELAEGGLGTYRYQGIWEMLDQVLVSNSLLDVGTGLFTEKSMVRIFDPEFLLKRDPKYPGYSPLSTYSGYKYQGGFSDHLPILLDLKVR